MDLHGDGNADLISGSWPGEIFIFRGGPGRTFAPPVMLKDKWGEEINVGGGVRTDKHWEDGSVFVAGTAAVEETPDGRVIRYHGKKYPIEKGKQVGITGTASAVHAADWDGDGVIDLIVGNFDGEVWLVPNEGTKTEPSFGTPVRLEADGKPLSVDGDAGPFVADWDGDGLPDLLVGAGDGSVTFFKNVGTRTKPVLAAGEILVPASKMDYEHPPKEPTRGIRAKPCVVDWDGDGHVDLLVGDMAEQMPDRPPQTPVQKADADKAKAEYDSLTASFAELWKKLGKETNEDERKRLKAEVSRVEERLSALCGMVQSPAEGHGWVWFFRRKPVSGKRRG